MNYGDDGRKEGTKEAEVGIKKRKERSRGRKEGGKEGSQRKQGS